MNDFDKARQVAYLQLDAAQHFFLIAHNGGRLHVSGDLNAIDCVKGMIVRVMMQGITKEDFLQVVNQFANEAWPGDACPPIFRDDLTTPHNP